jgi:uncharacterized membrane protein
MTRWLYVSLPLTAVAFAASLIVFANRAEWIADEVPTHWGLSGKPDQFTPRDAMLPHLLVGPVVMAVFIGLTFALPWLSPKRFKIDEFRGTFNYLMTLLVVLMGYMHAVLLTGDTHPGLDVSRPLVGGIFLFLALIGNQLGKVRPNFWMGVRTPWTLASEPVWTQTHRLAAWLLVAAGIAGFFVVEAGYMIVAAALLLFACLVPAVYSAVLYKRLERAGKL